MSISKIPIVPAFIPSSEEEVKTFCKELRFVHEIHIDVVDGVFVSATSWPHEPIGTPATVKHTTDAFTLEVDLMVAKPFKAARDWEAAGADMLVFHVETIDLESFKDFIAHTGITVGISFHGETTLESVLPYIEIADYVQVMGINTIGLQGQPFSEETISKIEKIKQIFPNKTVSVDGAVSASTIPSLVKAGANRLIVGSAIVKQPDMRAAYEQLVQTVNEA